MMQQSGVASSDGYVPEETVAYLAVWGHGVYVFSAGEEVGMLP